MRRLTLWRLCALVALLCAYASMLSAHDVYSLSIEKPKRMFVKTGAAGHKNTFIVHNYGNIDQKNCHYKATINGKVVEEKTINFPQIVKPNAAVNITVNIPPQSKAGDYELAFEITLINGKPNASGGKSAKLPITAINKLPTCRVVFEDYTANWCSWCPQGIGVMREMAKKHGADFIGIVAHQGDEMNISGYNVPYNSHSGVPAVYAARANKVEGYSGELYYQMAKQRGALMDVNVQAQWNAQGTDINVQSTTTFRGTRSNTHYALAYVLLEDPVRKNGWGQQNGYSGSKSFIGSNAEFNYFVNSPKFLPNFNFEDVVRAHLGIANGLQGSLPANVVADKAVVHKATFAGAGKQSNILNHKNLRVVVLVIDTQEQRIVNAARCTIKGKSVTNISTPTAAQQRVEVARFNLNGQRLSEPQPGVNIVKYSDGSVEKVQVRP